DDGRRLEGNRARPLKPERTTGKRDGPASAGPLRFEFAAEPCSVLATNDAAGRIAVGRAISPIAADVRPVRAVVAVDVLVFREAGSVELTVVAEARPVDRRPIARAVARRPADRLLVDRERIVRVRGAHGHAGDHAGERESSE